MNKDEYYLKIAEAVSMKSHCLKKHYGAIIVNNDEIVSTGYNGCPRGEKHCEVCTKIDGHKAEDEYFSCPAVHAEQNAIISASRKEMIGGTLYLYGRDVELNKVAEKVIPCEICARLIKNSGLIRVLTPTHEWCYNEGHGGWIRMVREENE